MINEIYDSLYGDKKYHIKSDFNNIFQLPIELIEDKKELENNILNDMEMLDSSNNMSENPNDNSLNNIVSIYNNVLIPKNIFDKQLVNKWSKYYTNNEEYLLDTQNLLKKHKNITVFNELSNNDYELDIYNTCSKLFYDHGFCNTYQYINLPYLDKFNSNELMMLLVSGYNICSPLCSLLIPIFSLIMPFFIIKLQGFSITFSLYFEHLKNVFSNQIVSSLFGDFSQASFSSKIYIILSVVLYLFQIYQNIIGCISYFKNLKYIHEIFEKIKIYLNNTLNKMKNLLTYTSSLNSYTNFNKTIDYNYNILNDYYNNILKVNSYNISVHKIFELGIIMKEFYKLNNDKELITSFYYSFGINGYISNLNEIQKSIKKNKMNFCKFIEKDNKNNTNFDNSYYAKLLDNSNNIIKNSYDLEKNMILTGPNAAGKTTILKTSLFNIILSQQIGCGFYNSAEIKLYDYIHCYINIPDTSNRDSLFQAEARRCKEILEIIDNNIDKRHFCVFDELYSGTNPDEAVKSGYGFLNYLNNKKNVDYILTTHYYKLCKLLKKSSKVENYSMKINKKLDSNDYDFTYKLKKGISKVKGGIKVLKDLEYPELILKNMNL